MSTVAWSGDGKRIAIGCEDGEIRVLEIGDQEGELLEQQPDRGQGRVTGLSFAKDGKALMVIFDEKEGQLARIYHHRKVESPDDTPEAEDTADDGSEDPPSKAEQQASQLKWQPVLIGGSEKANIVVGDLSTDGQRAITGNRSGQLELWNVSLLATAITADPNEVDQSDQELNKQIDQRRLLQVGEFSSAVQFVHFAETKEPGRGVQTDIFAAEKSDGNKLQVFRTTR